MAFCIAVAPAEAFRRRAATLGLSGALLGAMSPVWAQAPVPPAPVVVTMGETAASAARPTGIAVPRLAGRLTAADIGLVINTADPYSVAVGEHYARRRSLAPGQVLRVELPVVPTLTPDAFETLRRAIDERFGRRVQALALAWVAPYAVDCNSIGGALAMGFDPELCRNSCAPSRPSRYFNSASFRPFAELGFRPSMLLAARSVEQARALIDRGVAADHALSRRGRPPVSALMLLTDDVPRRVRTRLFPPAGPVASTGVNVEVLPESALGNARRVVMVSTGSARVALDPAPDWAPGALADHLTSFGGALLWDTGQSTALDWIASGVTATHGSVSEPCNHLQKFPHPQVLLLHYLQGATALEAYWKSVLWPQQALFVGEPLAAPFSPPLRRPDPPAPAPEPASAPLPPPEPAAPASAPG